MLKGMSSSPLESVLLKRQVKKSLPSMKSSMTLKMPKLGKSEMQPKVKPLASGFHHSMFPGLR